MIRHVWLDFSDTIARIDTAKHDAVKYGAFAEQSGREDSPQLRSEYDALYKQHGYSNSNVFTQTFHLGSDFWPGLIAKQTDMCVLADPVIPSVIERLARQLPVSVFSNIDTQETMSDLGIDTRLFTHILSSATLQHPKPHIEGYEKVIELSGLPAQDILYVGDIEAKDVLPAKSVGLLAGIIWDTSDRADFVFRDFTDMLAQIEEYNNM